MERSGASLISRPVLWLLESQLLEGVLLLGIITALYFLRVVLIKNNTAQGSHGVI